jgi:hypothetical protein
LPIDVLEITVLPAGVDARRHLVDRGLGDLAELGKRGARCAG